MTRTLECAPLSTSLTPACSAKTNPEQPAETSNPHAPLAPILSCTRHAVEGNIMSGVTVPTMMTSTSVGCDAARGQAFFCGLNADVADAQSLGEHVPLADTGPLDDPLVVGVDHLFEVLIGENLGGNVGAERRNLGAAAHHGTNGEAQWTSPCGANPESVLRPAAHILGKLATACGHTEPRPRLKTRAGAQKSTG